VASWARTHAVSWAGTDVAEELIPSFPETARQPHADEVRFASHNNILFPAIYHVSTSEGSLHL
jgi:hypothetical protein